MEKVFINPKIQYSTLYTLGHVHECKLAARMVVSEIDPLQPFTSNNVIFPKERVSCYRYSTLLIHQFNIFGKVR